MSPEDESALVQDIAGFTHDPLGYVLYAFPWGVKGTELEDLSGPRQWQREELDELGAYLRNGGTFQGVYRKAIASGHGPGKTALLCWLIKWGVDTCPDAKVVVTANTATQLTTKTWSELAKWHSLSLTKHWFDHTATALISTDGEHGKTWRADAIPWSEHNTEAFAGLHNKGKRIVVLFEEGSAIADKVWEVTEGALTDEDTEIIWVAVGNPTQSTGYFRECFRRFRHRWRIRHIDSRDVEGTNKELFAQWVADYGEDSDFVKVRVRGMFPSLSLKGLFSEADVDAGYGKALHESHYAFAPKILACDGSWTGGDPLVIGLRQGLAFSILRKIPYNDNDIQVASLLAQLEDEHEADAVFIDFGYGTGIISAGRTLNRTWVGVNFGGESSDPGCLNKRSEMALNVRNWLKEGGAYPADMALRQQMLDIEIKPRLDNKLQLESKEEMRKRGVASPNELDCLMLTHAHPVQKKWRGEATGVNTATIDYKPHARLARRR